MNGFLPLPGRIYTRLLRRWAPSLDSQYVSEAVDTFLTLSAEARASGPLALMAFWLREVRSLTHTAFSEWRTRRRRRGIEKALVGTDRPSKPDPEFRRTGRWLEGVLVDTRYALRNLARAPGFTTITVFSLTFGIATSTVLFSVANAVFFRPMPHAEDPDALVHLFAGHGSPARLPVSYPEFVDLRGSMGTLADAAVSRDRQFYVGSAAEASRRVFGQQVSENYFDVLGISMARGRGFLPEDIEAHRAVAVIGHNLWQRRFDGDPGVLGRELLIDGRAYAIIGVGPPGMVDPESPVLLEVVIPVMEEREDRGHMAFTGVGRLREGVSLSHVQAELDAFSLHMAEAYPENWIREGEVPRSIYALTRQQAMLPDNSTFWLAAAGFLMVVGLILLITCSNVATLLLTRAHHRREELGVRVAVGARSRRILGQLLTENLVLFGLAGAASFLLISVLASAIKGGWFFSPSVGANFDVDARVATFTFGLTLLAGLTFGLLPAKQASRADLISAIKGEAVPLRFKRFGIRNLLVGVQVAGSTVFVMVTIFLLQSLSHIRDLDLGFDPEGVAVLSMNLDHRQYGEEDGRQFLASLASKLEGMSGVEDVEISTRVPLEGGSTYIGGLEPEGYPLDPGEPVLAGMTVVSPGYLDLLRVSLLRGRPLLPEDREGGEAVALASQAFVDRYWPGEAGVGKIIHREGRDPMRVVGIVADLPMRSLAEEPGPHLWLPHNQWYDGDVVVNVRSVGDVRRLLPSLRSQVAELDPDLPVLRVDLMKNITANGSLPQRVLSVIMGVAGTLALALAMLGVYGVVAFSVSQRTREIGVRVALGAEPGQVGRMVVGEGFGVALVGLLPGLLLSLAAARVLRTFFLGADTLDPLPFGAGLILLGMAVLAACLVPAFRASRAHPMGSLRAD